MIDANVAIFFIFAVLYLIGHSTKSYVLIIGAGILLLGTAGTLTLFSLPWQNYVFAIMLSLSSIYHAIALIKAGREHL